jgi:hypothetical protein
VEECKAITKGCYNVLLGTAKHRALEERLLLIALTYCSIERQAGYAERALAVLQALLEVNFKCPPKLQQQNLTREAFLSFFQAFWDSEVPRIGEEASTAKLFTQEKMCLEW